MHVRRRQFPLQNDADESPSEDPYARLLQLAEQIPNVLTALPPISEGSRMAADKAATQDLMVVLPMLCAHYLGGSEDFLAALHHLMVLGPDTWQIPRFALYPLIRGVIESSCQTVWVLGPDDRRERFRRLLQLQKDELDYDGKYINARTQPLDGDSREIRSVTDKVRRDTELKRRTRLQWLRDAAAAVDITEDEYMGGLQGGYVTMIRDACA
jgi:hypothetical protein